MKNRSLRIFFSLLITFTISLLSQERNISVDDVIETIIDSRAETDDPQSTADDLEYFRSHPVDVSRPVYSELIQLPMISPMLAESIILLSDSVDVTEIDQIRSAALMNDRSFELLRPFITACSGFSAAELFSFLPSKIETRIRTEKKLQTSEAVTESQFRGGAASSYERMKLFGNHADLFALFEKDPGETVSSGFMTGALVLKDIGTVKRIVLGDYSIAADQGLLLSKNLSSSKGKDAVDQVRRKGRILSPNTSADELRYFRGGAFETTWEGFSFLGFYSTRELPASIDTSGTITALYSSGLFRTENELRKKNTLQEKTIGSRLALDVSEHGNIAFSFISVSYDHRFKDPAFTLRNNQMLNAGSIAFDLPIEWFTLFGETASSDLKTMSHTGGVIVPLSKHMSLSYHHRTYIRGYGTPFSRTFGERSSMGEGENGNYLGVSFAKDRFAVNAYVDRFTFPAAGNEFTQSGIESFLSVEIPLAKKIDLYFHSRNKSRPYGYSNSDDDERKQTNYRVEIRSVLFRSLTLTNRIEFSRISYAPSGQNENGMLMFIDAAFRNTNTALRIRSRLIFFDTPSFDSRLYQFESDVPGNYSNPPLYGEGMRWYLVAGIELWNDVVCSIKYSFTKKLDQTLVRIGGDSDPANSDDHLALQIDFR